jgi:tRNA(Ile)-lysidine synthase
MRERRIPILVTAHHANDNLETVLFRIARGTGLRGLCGIPEKRDFASGLLVRPLLAYSKRELVAICAREEIPFAQDSTNFSDDAARNRIRHSAVPSLETVASDPTGSVYRLTRALAQDEDCLSSMAEALLDEHRRTGRIPVEPLLRAHPAIRVRALSRLCEGGADAVHLEALERLLQTGRSGSSCPLPGDLCACLQGGELMILPKLRVPLGSDPIPFFEGCRAFCDGKLTVFVKRLENSESSENVHSLSTSASIIIDGVWNPDQLFFRARWESDTLLRQGKKQRLGRLFSEAGVPPMLRDSLPILCDGEGILWVPFVGLREGVRSEMGVRYEICVTVHKNMTEQKGLDNEFTQQ